MSVLDGAPQKLTGDALCSSYDQCMQPKVNAFLVGNTTAMEAVRMVGPSVMDIDMPQGAEPIESTVSSAPAAPKR